MDRHRKEATLRDLKRAREAAERIKGIAARYTEMGEQADAIIDTLEVIAARLDEEPS